MTRLDQLAQAFPLHVQRIAELTWEHCRRDLRDEEPCGCAEFALVSAFPFTYTEEGHSYWAALAFRNGAALAFRNGALA